MDERLLLWLSAMLIISAMAHMVSRFRYRRSLEKQFRSGRTKAYVVGERSFYPCKLLNVRNGGKEFLCSGPNFLAPKWISAYKLQEFH